MMRGNHDHVGKWYCDGPQIKAFRKNLRQSLHVSASQNALPTVASPTKTYGKTSTAANSSQVGS